MKSIGLSKIKVWSAVIGGGGAVAMVALGAISEPTPAGGALVATSANANIGSTTTETTPSNVPAVTMAVPAIKGPAPLPAEEQAPAAP